MKVRSKPVLKDAFHWQGTIAGWPDWLEESLNMGDISIDYPTVTIKTLEGTITASLNDWIIRGIHGELYPCKPHIFEATYDEVAE